VLAVEAAMLQGISASEQRRAAEVLLRCADNVDSA
jgi:hypothetical protein